MQASDYAETSFEDSDTRSDEMYSTIDAWITELSDLVTEAKASEEFQAWLDVQSRFRDYSYRNTLLIKLQKPEATHVAGYRTWQTEFDRQVRKGESAIWIWAPVISKRCPDCGNSPTYHSRSDCAYEEASPDEWERGLVGFKPAPVFDVSQTEGEPLPKLGTEAVGAVDDLVPKLLDSADELGVSVQIVPESDWEHGAAKGICTARQSSDEPRIEVRARENQADLAVTVIHEYAHALLHAGIDDTLERSKREVEAEAVAYVVGRYFGVDTDNSAFYLAAWQEDDAASIADRLTRISEAARELIDVIER